MKNLKLEYAAPTIEMEVVAVEQGFAASELRCYIEGTQWGETVEEW